jgi:hypothetical protein
MFKLFPKRINKERVFDKRFDENFTNASGRKNARKCYT